MENIKTSNPKSTAGWVFGGLSFIPWVGVLFGIIAVLIGINSKNRNQILLGSAGILSTVALYFVVIHIMGGPREGLYSTNRIKTDAGFIRVYRNKNGKLPEKITDLEVSSQADLFFLKDGWGTEIFYQPKGNGTFELRSAGPDKILNTQDDISQIF